MNPPAWRRIPLRLAVLVALLVGGCGASRGTAEQTDASAAATEVLSDVASDATAGGPIGDDEGTDTSASETSDDGPAPSDREPTDDEPAQQPVADLTASPTPEAPDAPVAAPAPTATAEPNPLAEAITPLPPATIGIPTDAPSDRTAPVALTIDSLSISTVGVVQSGVNPDETFEVPPADRVGWYKFGSTPGEQGSAVLAAHIAFNGEDGVFRNLDEIRVGAEVDVVMDDGSITTWRVTRVDEYRKEALPDSLFARDGEPQLVLITCGGSFNRQLSSYDSNVVVVASPV